MKGCPDPSALRFFGIFALKTLFAPKVENDEILSGNVEILSENVEILSENVEILRENVEFLSEND